MVGHTSSGLPERLTGSIITCLSRFEPGTEAVYSEANLMQVRRWKAEWSNSPLLQQQFPSLATFLVFRASDCRSFHRPRCRAQVVVRLPARPSTAQQHGKIRAVG